MKNGHVEQWHPKGALGVAIKGYTVCREGKLGNQRVTVDLLFITSLLAILNEVSDKTLLLPGGHSR